MNPLHHFNTTPEKLWDLSDIQMRFLPAFAFGACEVKAHRSFTVSSRQKKLWIFIISAIIIGEIDLCLSEKRTFLLVVAYTASDKLLRFAVVRRETDVD